VQVKSTESFVLAFSVAAAIGISSTCGAVTLAGDGQATATVVLGDSPTNAERTAANELADYLTQVTGGTFVVQLESEASRETAAIFVGWTSYAKEHGVDVGAFGPEEWVMRVIDGNLILAGGRPRGTLYAVYRFLEDEVGVHWWNPFEETVPRQPRLEIQKLDRRGEPAFRYRDIYMLYGNDGGRFAARNRLNREGDAGIRGEYGGEMGYGAPAHVHTFNRYVPPAKYFETHPEWFPLIDGERSSGNVQLCLTNQELRELFVKKLVAYIQQSRAYAAKQDRPAPLVFDISQNDSAGMCQCEPCQALANAEGSEAGPLFDFVNYMADAIKDDYPEVYIDTLAYQMTQEAPKTIRPRENVVVRLCDTTSNFTKPITHPDNAAFKQHVVTWGAITKNLRIWDYGVNYGRFHSLPMPTVHTYPTDYQFYAEHNVEGVFTELEYPVLADMRDFKVWMMMKLLEDPYRDYAALVRTFTDGFYGPAGEHIRRYLARLEAASEEKTSYLSMTSAPRSCHYLDLAFVTEALAIFDEAERIVGEDPTLLRRVRHARLPVERAAVVRYRELAEEWVGMGNPIETMPLDREAIGERYRDTWQTEIDLRIPEAGRVKERADADREVRQLLGLPSSVPLPERFQSLPRDAVTQYTAWDSRNHRDVVKRVGDGEAESGTTNRLELSDEDMKKYQLPMPWGLYDVANTCSAGSATIAPEDVPGPGYNWYKMGTFSIGPTYYLYFFWSWIIQIDVDNVIYSGNPEREFDIWAMVKFQGPGFPHGRAEDTNAICVERVVLVEAGVQ
jgi:Domain of unknown function (DUF4838)